VAKGNLGQKDIIYLCIFRISFCWKNDKKKWFAVINEITVVPLLKDHAFCNENLA
jgi:hypothetical protein